MKKFINLNKDLSQRLFDMGVVVGTEFVHIIPKTSTKPFIAFNSQFSYVTKNGMQIDKRTDAKVYPAPATMDEFVELFKKLGEVKGWKDDGIEMVMSRIEWKENFLKFTELTAENWGKGEEYLAMLLK